MKTRERLIKTWAAADNITLGKMWDKCQERGFTVCLAETHEALIDYVVDNIRGYMKVAPLIASIENNPYADFYGFDITSYSNAPATPIYTKSELAAILLGE